MDFCLLDEQSEQSLMFPVNPQNVTVSQGTKTLNFTPIKLGDVDIPRGRVPIQFTWESFLPGAERTLPYTKNSLIPNAIINQLREWLNTNKKLRLVITETPWNIPVFISVFDTTHGDAAGDVHYTINLIEWREMLVTEKAVFSANTIRPVNKSTPKSHTVVKGDTLWGIAKKYTNKGNRWPELWEINKNKSRSKNPNLIYPGEVFTLPAGW